MNLFICTTCGTQFKKTDAPPKVCPICKDERQYVNPGGAAMDDPGVAKKES